jgi:hypothetical protein
MKKTYHPVNLTVATPPSRRRGILGILKVLEEQNSPPPGRRSTLDLSRGRW